MRVNDDYASGWNVAAQRADDTSVLHFWRKCVKTRKAYADRLVCGGPERRDEVADSDLT